MSKKILVDCEHGRISDLAARNIAKDIYEFFQNEENMKKFEEWKKQKSTLN